MNSDFQAQKKNRLHETLVLTSRRMAIDKETQIEIERKKEREREQG